MPPASYAVWETGDLDVSAPADAVQRWSTDPRSRVPELPRLDPATRCRGAAGPCTGAPSSMAERLLPRLIRLGLSVLAGLLLCVSFPPMGWWWAAVPALALLTWVLVHPGTTMAGGFGYGLLFGLAFYLPLLPWIGGLVGAVPWILLSLMEALFPRGVRPLRRAGGPASGWPLWLACLWSMREWLKSSVPFGGFPWGVTAFSQTNGPFLVLAQWARRPAGVVRRHAACDVAVRPGARDRPASRRRAAPPPRRPSPAPDGPRRLRLRGAARHRAGSPGVRRTASAVGDEPTITVAAIQGNVPRLGLDFNSQRRAVLTTVTQTLQLAEDVKAGRVPQPQFVIWPENSSDIDPIANPDAARRSTSPPAPSGCRSSSAPSSPDRRPPPTTRPRPTPSSSGTR